MPQKESENNLASSISVMDAVNQDRDNGTEGKGLKITLTIILAFVICLVFGTIITHIILRENFGKTSSVQIPESWKGSSLFNMSDFKWIKNNATICSNDGRARENQDKLLLILVNSAREHYDERSAIRKSLEIMTNKIKKSAINWTVKLVFFLGVAYGPANSNEHDALLMEETFLDQEFSVYRDLVCGNIIENSENLTMKTLMSLKWALTYCEDATFIVKMEDDVFFNVPKFVEWRDTEMSTQTNFTEMPDLFCIPETNRKPLREATGKSFEQVRWLVTKMEWPEDHFPDYCRGVLYGVTVDLAKKMFDVSSLAKYFRMEDIYFTGVVMEKIKEKYGPVYKQDVKVGLESEQTIQTICENKVMRQTVSQEIGLVIELERGSNIEKQMLCLARDV